MKKYNISIWILWIVSFLCGLEIAGPFIIPFFKDWGGLNQTQIQTLQSWFMLWIFLLEIPTGLIGDVRGRKFSVVASTIFWTIGPVVYALIPDFRIFLLGEFLLAIGTAFNSGAMEALLYDTVKEQGLVKEYPRIASVHGNMQLIGMMAGAAIGSILINYLPINVLFASWSIPFAISGILLFIFIKEPKIENKKLEPNYIKTFKTAFLQLRNHKVLRKLAIYSMIIGSLTYFAMWFYQNVLLEAGVKSEDMGPYKILLLIAEIIAVTVIMELLTKRENRRRIIIIIILLIGAGFLVAFMKTYWGALIFMIFAAGIGVKFRSIFSPFINSHIQSEQRATVLSGVSMIRQVILVVINPLVGFMVDWNLGITLGILGIITVVYGLVFAPKNEELVMK